jgi:hypothetical protein
MISDNFKPGQKKERREVTLVRFSTLAIISSPGIVNDLAERRERGVVPTNNTLKVCSKVLALT